MLVYDTALEELVGDELVAIAAVEEGEEHSEGDDETVNPVLPTGSDIIYAAIFFVALWAAMKYVLLPPIMKVRAERAAKIAAARDAADNASADMGTAQADYDAALADARAEAASILETARAEADAARSEVVGAAEADAAQVRAAAASEIAGAVGTVNKARLGQFRIAEVAPRQVRTANADFAHLAETDEFSVAAGDEELDVLHAGAEG